MKKNLLSAFTIFILSANIAHAENLLCSVIVNNDTLVDTSLAINLNEQINYSRMGSYSFYVKNLGDSLFELEIYNSNGPERSYAQGHLRLAADKLAWTIWTRDILLETNCRLAEEL